jgi:galactose-1-phosphate uridylyltransferase
LKLPETIAYKPVHPSHYIKKENINLIKIMRWTCVVNLATRKCVEKSIPSLWVKPFATKFK